MSEDAPEKSIKALAEEYLSAQEQETSPKDLEETKAHLTELQERYERFENDYAESDPATQQLAERISETEKQIAELEEAQRIPEELKEQIIEEATGFMPTEEWLDPDVIEALNLALIGERDSALVIEEIEISGTGDVDDLDDITRFDIIDVVRKLALDKLGRTSEVQEVWASIADTTKEEPFEIVAQLGRATPDEVVERVDVDDADRETISNRLRNATRLQINPYFREDGVYQLSTAGKHFAQKYAEIPEDVGNKSQEGAQQEDEGQATLGQNTADQGGDADD
jgi:polyhydroxyalkanoate synthesis regulator phasin